MANNINNMKDAPGVIAKLAAGMLADKAQFCKSIDREDSSIFDGMNGYQAGDTVQISKPARFTANTTADVTSAIQDVVEEKTSLTLDVRSNVPVQLNSAEVFTELGLKKWTSRILEPAMETIKNDVEQRFIAKAVDNTFNSVGTPGSETFTQDTMLSAAQKIYENGCTDYSPENNFALLTPFATRKAVVGRADLQNPSPEVSEQYKSGVMGLADGFTYLRNNLLPTVTNSSDVTGIAINGTPAEGDTTLTIDGASAAPAVGSVFTIAGVNAVHPITKEDLGFEKQFVVTAATTTTITLAETDYLYAGSNGLQNISALPSDNDALTFVGSASTAYRQNIAYHKSAFRMVSVPLMLPSDAHFAAQETVDDMTVRVWMASDVLTDTMTARIDFLGGLALTRPEWAVRITE